MFPRLLIRRVALCFPGYFSQFGDVLKVRLSRSKDTGKSKGYAFLEFESSDVAKIAAGAMHDYLMFGQKLVCRVVPRDEVHPHTFKGANKRFKKIPWRKIESERQNKERTKGDELKRQRRLLRKDNARRKRLAEICIEYDFEGYAEDTGAFRMQAKPHSVGSEMTHRTLQPARARSRNTD